MAAPVSFSPQVVVTTTNTAITQVTVINSTGSTTTAHVHSRERQYTTALAALVFYRQRRYPQETLKAQASRFACSVYRYIKKNSNHIFNGTAVLIALAIVILLAEKKLLPDWQYTATHWFIKSLQKWRWRM